MEALSILRPSRQRCPDHTIANETQLCPPATRSLYPETSLSFQIKGNVKQGLWALSVQVPETIARLPADHGEKAGILGRDEEKQ
jgi:hypothetical protein